MNKSSGQISRFILVLAVVVLIVIAIIYFATKFSTVKKAQQEKLQNTTGNVNEPPKPVYDTQIGDVKFIFESAINFGSVLRSNMSYPPDLVTTEKFIKVTIGAQNKGKSNVLQSSWDIGNIIDSDGRNFIPIINQAYFWLPKIDLCGSILKPEFEPTPCVKIYEVSKASDSLKIEVNATLDLNSSKKQKSFVDLLVTEY